ncbi:MAG: KH domain-containing protein [Anaerolineales bacterium]|nr:KH domain-containing protein [Anaerolineales bacterium]
MAEQQPTVELSVAADEVEAAVARTCAEWRLARAEVRVETRPDEGAPGQVRVRVMAARGAIVAAGDDDEDLARARQVLAELLARMGVAAEIHASRGEPDGGITPIVLDIQGLDLGELIGHKGETLAALQYIARLIVSKQAGRSVDLIVDVQGHKKRREEQLGRLAHRLAEQAVERQRVMSFEPMPANERRIIHLALRDYPGVQTESVGEGTHRKVTIIPHPR